MQIVKELVHFNRPDTNTGLNKTRSLNPFDSQSR